jgi:hypothetical protein
MYYIYIYIYTNVSWTITQPLGKMELCHLLALAGTGNHHGEWDKPRWKDKYHMISLICGT